MRRQGKYLGLVLSLCLAAVFTLALVLTHQATIGNFFLVSWIVFAGLTLHFRSRGNNTHD